MMKGTSFDSIIVQKDTCIACALLKRKLLGYGGSMTDTTSLKTYLNDSFPLFVQNANNWLSSLRNCKLLKEYVATGASEAFFEMGLGSSSEYRFGRGDISIEAWVNITDTTNNKVIFSTETYSFSFGAMSGVSFLVHGSQPLLELCDGQQDVDLLGSTHLPINTWHHLVATRTGNYWTSWHIYVDGSSISVSDFTGFSYSGLYVTTNLVSGNIDTVGTTPYIGLNDGTSNKWPFIGDYRQVRLYNRVISSSEVTASYNGGCGGPPSDTSKLVMWCPLYEGGGYYGHDISRFNDYGDDWYGGSSPFVRNIDTTCFVNGTAVCKLVNVKRACYAADNFNSKRLDNELNGAYEYGFREYGGPEYDDTRFWSIDPLTRKYPYLSPYIFASDNPISGIDLDGLEYLNSNDALVEFRSGKLQVDVTNFKSVTLSRWNTAIKDPNNWSVDDQGHKEVGIDVTIGNLSVINGQNQFYTPSSLQKGGKKSEIPESPEIPDDNLPSSNKPQTNPITGQGADLSNTAISKASTIVAAAEFLLNSAASYIVAEDYSTIQAQTKVAQLVIKQVNIALGNGEIPKKYQNVEALSGIMNVVLSGRSNSDNPDIYTIGMKIYHEFNPPPIPQPVPVPSQRDNTNVITPPSTTPPSQNTK